VFARRPVDRDPGKVTTLTGISPFQVTLGLLVMSVRRREAKGSTSEPRQTSTVINHHDTPDTARRITISQLAPALIDFYTVRKLSYQLR
jgi:hypothetical protein